MCIWIQDKKGKWNEWEVYGETEITYKIYAVKDKRFITEVYIHNIFCMRDILYSSEIKNPFDTMPERYFRTEFGEFWLKKDEC